MRTMMAAALTCAMSTTWASAFDTGKLGMGGTLFLDDIAPLIKKSPQLHGEVAAALAKLNRKAEDIVCSGMRFPGTWKELGGARVAPYSCEIGDQSLEIRARVRVTRGKGKVYETITPDAMKNADTVNEDNPTWTWAKAKSGDQR